MIIIRLKLVLHVQFHSYIIACKIFVRQHSCFPLLLLLLLIVIVIVVVNVVVVVVLVVICNIQFKMLSTHVHYCINLQ